MLKNKYHLLAILLLIITLLITWNIVIPYISSTKSLAKEYNNLKEGIKNNSDYKNNIVKLRRAKKKLTKNNISGQKLTLDQSLEKIRNASKKHKLAIKNIKNIKQNKYEISMVGDYKNLCKFIRNIETMTNIRFLKTFMKKSDNNLSIELLVEL